MSATDESDGLEDLLGRPNLETQADELRRSALAHAVLAQTAGVLRRRRITRRCGWIAALAGCYLAGVASMGAWRWDRPGLFVLTHETATSGPARSEPAISEPAHQETHQAASEPIRETTPAVAERARTPFEKLRDAGDEAWRRRGDLEAAIRLYAQAVRVATPNELTISAVDDNWLLMALKEDRIKESPHVENHDKS